MSRDYHLLIDTETSPQMLSDYLIARRGLVRDDHGWLLGPGVNAIVNRGKPSDVHLAEPGIARVTLRVTLMPSRGAAGQSEQAIFKLAADILRFCPGDAVLAPQDAESALLRRGDEVRIDPGQAPPGWPSEGELGSDKVAAGLPAG